MGARRAPDHEAPLRLAAALLLGGVAWAAQPGPKYEMTTYVVGFLKRGSAWTAAATPESAEIQKQHLAHIQKMADSGKLIVAGPFSGGDGDIRGMLVFHGITLEQAKAFAAEDPAVKSGRLVLDVHGWRAAKGLRIDPPTQ